MRHGTCDVKRLFCGGGWQNRHHFIKSLSNNKLLLIFRGAQNFLSFFSKQRNFCNGLLTNWIVEEVLASHLYNSPVFVLGIFLSA